VTEQLTDLIVYATPSGPLGEQINDYLTQTRERFGANTAHQYPAHCTLTGFFHDVPRAIPEYLAALAKATAEMVARTPVPVDIERIRLDGGWYGLELRSPWLIDLAAAFKRHAPNIARPDEVRLKDWLHLSLAYGFEEQHAIELASAASSIDIASEVHWEVALWQRDGSVWPRH
jgi:hypothetical protein